MTPTFRDPCRLYTVLVNLSDGAEIGFEVLAPDEDEAMRLALAAASGEGTPTDVAVNDAHQPWPDPLCTPGVRQRLGRSMPLG